MNQWGFYYNQTRCIGCKACTLACKSWNDKHRGDLNLNVELSWVESDMQKESIDYETVPSGEQNFALFRKYYMKENWRRVTITEYGTNPPDVDVQYLSVACNHCDNPACIEVCPMGIIFKESEYGIVLVDNTDCISCGKCQDACPWDAPQFYDTNFKKYAQDDPKRPKMTKCTLCLDRIKEGLKPACVAACMNRALDAGPLDELKERYRNADITVDTFASDSVPSLGISTKPNIIFKARKRRV